MDLRVSDNDTATTISVIDSRPRHGHVDTLADVSLEDHPAAHALS
jgi:hypothetical protein